MERQNHRTLARLGDYASVESFDTGKAEIIQINFMNITLRMCCKQFQEFTVMLNEAMMQVLEGDSYFSNMKRAFYIADRLKPGAIDEEQKN
jgi:hypothetical protein